MLIRVKVRPNSKKGEILQKSQELFEIKVKEKPIQGQANSQVKEMLAGYLKIPLKNLRLKNGARKRNKIFEIII